MERQFFISYNSQDVEYVKEIVDIIERYGVKCWFQLNDSKNDFFDEIIKGIKESFGFIVFVSPNSADSDFVRKEIMYAIKQKKHILPIVLEGTDIQDEKFAWMDLCFSNINMLFSNEFDSSNDLVLKIFQQLDISFDANENLVASTYSGASDIETRRIEIQNNLFNKYANKHLDQVFDEINMPHILDVGCANGNNIISRVKDRAYSSLLGIDIDGNKIKDAQKFANEKNRFLCLDISEESSADYLKKYCKDNNIAGFDIIHISYVLLHLGNPYKMICTLKSLLSPNGVLFIMDQDDGMNLAYPEEAYFQDVSFIYVHSIESGDRRMGRKIANLLVKADFRSIELARNCITSIDFQGEEKEKLWDIYFNPNYWVTTDSSYFDDISAVKKIKNCQESHENLKKRYMNGEFFVSLGMFIYIAKK